MTTPFPFEGLLLFGSLSIMLIIGVLLRANVPFLQRFLFPSCLIGGVIGLLIINLGLLDLEATDLETFAYHFFNISFISVGLTSGKSKASPERKTNPLKGPLWMALVEGVTLPLQAVTGGLLIIIFGWFGMELFPTFGFLAPLGFTEGPGQALSIGKVWEGAGFAHAATIGLTFSAIGFFFAFFVGVPLVNWGIRKGYGSLAPKTISKDLLIGIVPKGSQKVSAGKLSMHSGNIDALAFQAAMVGVVYVLTYGFVMLLGKILPADAAKILWGFFFFFGMGIALVIRWGMGRIGIDFLIDAGVQHRITGWAVDYLIVTTVMAIQLVVIWQYIIPISIISLVSGVLTTAVVIYLGGRIEDYNLERTVAIYGTCTGTVSSGLLLLRIVDPEFETPVAVEIGVMNVIVVPIIVGCLLLVNAPIWWHWSLGLTTFVFAAIMIICLAFIKLLGLWGASRFGNSESK
jgi:glutamate:Na+ symporter, ESS family